MRFCWIYCSHVFGILAICCFLFPNIDLVISFFFYLFLFFDWSYQLSFGLNIHFKLIRIWNYLCVYVCVWRRERWIFISVRTRYNKVNTYVNGHSNECQWIILPNGFDLVIRMNDIRVHTAHTHTHTYTVRSGISHLCQTCVCWCSTLSGLPINLTYALVTFIIILFFFLYFDYE